MPRGLRGPVWMWSRAALAAVQSSDLPGGCRRCPAWEVFQISSWELWDGEEESLSKSL